MPLLRILPLALACGILCGQTVRSWREANEHAILREYREFLAIPNVASDSVNIRRNAGYLRGMLEKRGVRTRLLETEGAPPAVLGEIESPGASRTLVFYAHYDGQPVEASPWTGGDPFRPVLRSGAKEVAEPPASQRFDPEWRIFARSSSDDKAPIMALAAALDALKAQGRAPRSNVKIFLEGEEEAGSPHLASIVREHRESLRGDVWLICDGPVHQTRRQQVYFGARGVTGLSLTVYGANRELHSGHYGNWAPNPAMMLARLLASMKDDEGHVLIDGWYEGVVPLSAAETAAIRDAPDSDGELRRELGLARTEGDGRKLLDLLNQPALNIRGISSGSTGAASRNVVPSEATASIDIRLVKGLDPAAMVERLAAHIRKQGYFVTDREPDMAVRLAHAKVARLTSGHGYRAVRTPMDLPIARAVVSAIESVRGPVVKLPTLGGSVPLYVFEDELNAPMVGVPIVNHDNNQHSSNENLRLQNLWDGIELMAALLAME